MRTTMWSLLALAPFVGCTDPALEQRVAELERKVEAQSTAAPAPGAPRKAAPDDPNAKAQEQAAMQILTEANQAVSAGDPETARAKLAVLAKDYAGTRTAARGEKLATELAVVGKDAPAMDVEKWYTADKADWKDGKVHLVVFFESWCPHCKDEAPKAAETYTKYKGKGLKVLGLTRVTKSATDESVAAFITERGVNFPVAKEKGDLARAFGVQGIPAAAVVKNGKIIWRGHPGRLTDAMLDGFLSSS